ncbi:hypothetical protein AB4Y38_43510, partial [Paraburkholderia sp. EG285A]
GREILQAPKVLVVAQPTWGVDVGAAAFIRQQLLDLSARGVAIYFDQSTGWWILFLMMFAGVLGGMAWAAIPAWLKSRFNT